MALSMCVATAPGLARPCESLTRRSVRRSVRSSQSQRTVCAAGLGDGASRSASDARRAVLGGLAASVLAPALPRAAVAYDDELTLFKGTASPPTSYGGYGGNAVESYKYQFMVPSNWKAEVINKVEKGTQGIDCKFTNPNIKGMQAFVIALGRAGEDDKSFKINDVESTFQGFAGADYAIQDALATAEDTVTTTVETEDGLKYYQYDVQSPIVHYQAVISTRRGKIFALFLKCPGPRYDENKQLLDDMMASFQTL